jgi:phage shock protein PspC (stress-responsive transcriptional regulator)
MFKEQNVNALIGILWGLAVYFNLHSLDPMTLNVFAIWAVCINRLFRHFNKGKKKK